MAKKWCLENGTLDPDTVNYDLIEIQTLIGPKDTCRIRKGKEKKEVKE